MTRIFPLADIALRLGLACYSVWTINGIFQNPIFHPQAPINHSQVLTK